MERWWGSKKFLIFYLLCGMAGAAFFTLLIFLGVLPGGMESPTGRRFGRNLRHLHRRGRHRPESAGDAAFPADRTLDAPTRHQLDGDLHRGDPAQIRRQRRRRGRPPGWGHSWIHPVRHPHGCWGAIRRTPSDRRAPHSPLRTQIETRIATCGWTRTPPWTRFSIKFPARVSKASPKPNARSSNKPPNTKTPIHDRRRNDRLPG